MTSMIGHGVGKQKRKRFSNADTSFGDNVSNA